MQKQPGWQLKFQEMLQTCQDEVKRTTEIGKKMLSASRTNSNLHEAYEELGVLAARALKDGSLNWDNARVKEILNTINNCEHDLEVIEDEVNKIKFSAGTMNVSSMQQQKQKEEKTQPEDSEPKAE